MGSSVTTYEHLKTWDVQKYDTGASAWVSDTALPRGAINTITQLDAGTMNVMDLADGSRGIFTPAVRYNEDPFGISWHRRTITTGSVAQLRNYLKDNTGLKITLHDSAATNLEGYIMSVNKTWDFTGSTQLHTIEIEFQPFDVDNNGIIG